MRWKPRHEISGRPVGPVTVDDEPEPQWYTRHEAILLAARLRADFEEESDAADQS